MFQKDRLTPTHLALQDTSSAGHLPRQFTSDAVAGSAPEVGVALLAVVWALARRANAPAARMEKRILILLGGKGNYAN